MTARQIDRQTDRLTDRQTNRQIDRQTYIQTDSHTIASILHKVVDGYDHQRATLQHKATCCNTLQHTATHCNALQRTATHCNIPQHTATRCNTLCIRLVLQPGRRQHSRGAAQLDRYINLHLLTIDRLTSLHSII